MTPRDFCYWLQGFFEVSETNLKTNESLTLSKKQVEVVREHLRIVFNQEAKTQVPGSFVPAEVPSNDIHTMVLSKPDVPNKNGDVFPKELMVGGVKQLWNEQTGKWEDAKLEHPFVAHMPWPPASC